MDGMTLLREARRAGLRAHIDGDRLVVRGPKIAADLAERMLAQKTEIVAILNGCDRCGCSESRDFPIHGGRSVRRDCARCGRFLDFPVWNPEPSQV